MRIDAILFYTDVPNLNKRIYTHECLTESIARLPQPSRILIYPTVEAAHSGDIALAVGEVVELTTKTTHIVASCRLMDTPWAKFLTEGLLDCSLRLSPGGIGKIENGIVSDYELKYTYIIPASESAFPYPISLVDIDESQDRTDVLHLK